MELITLVPSMAKSAGTERAQLQICRELARRGHTVHVAFCRPGQMEQNWLEFSSEMLYLRRFDAWRQLVSTAHGKRRSGRRIAYMHHNGRWENFAFAFLLGRVFRQPVCWHMHLPLPFGGRLPMPPTAVRLLRRLLSIDGAIFVSRANMSSWERVGFPTDGDNVVLNGVDVEYFVPAEGDQRKLCRDRLGVQEGTFMVAMVGRLNDEKGAPVLIDAWECLNRGRPELDTTLLLVGRVESVQTRAAIDRASIDGETRVTHRDWVSDPRTAYWAADLVVVPSVWDEPFGLVLVEAMACGCPVVTTRTGGCVEALGQWAKRYPFCVVSPGSSAELAAAIARVSEVGASEIERMSAAARQHAVDERDIRTTVASIEGHLLALASRTGAARFPH
ncbi:MAG: glycosyltransferase family 4 protein [Actinomycetota bacterium]|nr:glycosyltransferase family 4 protein [Actinomycetota bacterium]